MKETKYTIKYTTSFKKDYKRAIKRGLKIELLEQVVALLAMGEPDVYKRQAKRSLGFLHHYYGSPIPFFQMAAVFFSSLLLSLIHICCP